MIDIYIVYDEMELAPRASFLQGSDARDCCLDTLIALVEADEPYEADGLSITGNLDTPATPIAYWYQYEDGQKIHLVTMHKVKLT